MALLIAVLGAVSIYRMSTDILPEIDIHFLKVQSECEGTKELRKKSLDDETYLIDQSPRGPYRRW
jgi:hypothetical protein